jgi:hypothetical protein
VATVGDYLRCLTPDTAVTYAMLKHALVALYTPTQIDNCYKLLDEPPPLTSHSLTLLFDIQALLPTDANPDQRHLFALHAYRR